MEVIPNASSSLTGPTIFRDTLPTRPGGVGDEAIPLNKPRGQYGLQESHDAGQERRQAPDVRPNKPPARRHGAEEPLSASTSTQTHFGWEASGIPMAKCDLCDKRCRGTVYKCVECRLSVCQFCCQQGHLDRDSKHALDHAAVSWITHLKPGKPAKNNNNNNNNRRKRSSSTALPAGETRCSKRTTRRRREDSERESTVSPSSPSREMDRGEQQAGTPSHVHPVTSNGQEQQRGGQQQQQQQPPSTQGQAWSPLPPLPALPPMEPRVRTGPPASFEEACAYRLRVRRGSNRPAAT